MSVFLDEVGVRRFEKWFYNHTFDSLAEIEDRLMEALRAFENGKISVIYYCFPLDYGYCLVRYLVLRHNFFSAILLYNFL